MAARTRASAPAWARKPQQAQELLAGAFDGRATGKRIELVEQPFLQWKRARHIHGALFTAILSSQDLTWKWGPDAARAASIPRNACKNVS